MTILTREQMAQSIVDTLRDVTKDIPEERRVEVQGEILDAFATAMFHSGGPTKEKPMNAFHWRGKPSIFCYGKDAYFFTGKHEDNVLKQSWSDKPSIISLPGGSKHRPPKVMRRDKAVDKLLSGGELGRKV